MFLIKGNYLSHILYLWLSSVFIAYFTVNFKDDKVCWFLYWTLVYYWLFIWYLKSASLILEAEYFTGKKISLWGHEDLFPDSLYVINNSTTININKKYRLRSWSHFSYQKILIITVVLQISRQMNELIHLKIRPINNNVLEWRMIIKTIKNIFKFWLCPLLIMWPWANYFISQRLSFLICKMK